MGNTRQSNDGDILFIPILSSFTCVAPGKRVTVCAREYVAGCSVARRYVVFWRWSGRGASDLLSQPLAQDSKAAGEQTGHMHLGDANLGRDLRLGQSTDEAQRQNRPFSGR